MSVLSIVLLLLALGASPVWAQAASWTTAAQVCQILDKTADPAYSLGATYIERSRFGVYGVSRIVEFDGDWDLGYYRDVLLGDIDLRLKFDGTMFFSTGQLQLPERLAALRADAGWTWRYVNDTALQVRFAPGIYSDFEELSFRTFALPISVAGIMTITPELSATAGVQIRPGFDRVFMPIIGAIWGPADWLRAEATLPEARIIGYWDKAWSSHLAWAWESTTYAIKDGGDYDREQLTLEGCRTTLGVTHNLSYELRVTAEVGLLSGRSAIFQHTPVSMDDNIDVENAFFMRVGVGGPF